MGKCVIEEIPSKRGTMTIASEAAKQQKSDSIVCFWHVVANVIEIRLAVRQKMYILGCQISMFRQIIAMFRQVRLVRRGEGVKLP